MFQSHAAKFPGGVSHVIQSSFSNKVHFEAFFLQQLLFDWNVLIYISMPKWSFTQKRRHVTLKTQRHITEDRGTLQRSTCKCLELQSPYTVSSSCPSHPAVSTIAPSSFGMHSQTPSKKKALLRLA